MTTLWRKGFNLMTENGAERNGVAYKTAPAYGAAKPCMSEDGKPCEFTEGDCHGVPCTPHALRQYFPPGTKLRFDNVVWLKADRA